MQGSATTAMPLHRRGAMTKHMAPRRRNPKGGRHFAGARNEGTIEHVPAGHNGRRMQSAGHDARIHFSAAC
jgi:hypothetical protein